MARGAKGEVVGSRKRFYPLKARKLSFERDLKTRIITFVRIDRNHPAKLPDIEDECNVAGRWERKSVEQRDAGR